MPAVLCAVLLDGACAGADAGPPVAQTCDTSRYPLSAPSDRFEDHHDGTVTDKQSRLMWLRCPLGQQWSGDHCAGEAQRLSWPAAANIARRLNQGGKLFFNDWRIPQIHELATIAERQCENPRINLAVFPATPAAAFWSFTSRQPADAAVSAFVLSFGPEGVGYARKSEEHFVRLVRNGP
jgi:hypothetical protein